MIIGYTTGVFDLFHIGHVNLLRNARAICDKLIVGVTVDELVSYKGKHSVIPYVERLSVVQACRYVDAAIPQKSIDKIEAIKKLNADILFVGDDWHESENWQAMEKQLSEMGCRVTYFPYTEGTSSTLINQTLERLRN